MKYITLAFVIGMLVCGFSSAATINVYTLNQDGCTGSCGAAPFATVTLEQTTPTMVTVIETLASSEVYAGTGAGNALAFNVTGAGLISIADISAGFAIGPAPTAASTFGAFLQSIACTSCQGGQAGNPPGPLSFTVTSSVGVTIANFTPNGKGYMFASDITGANGNTGNVAAIGSSAGVPEPGTFALIAAGACGLGVLRRRRLRK